MSLLSNAFKLGTITIDKDYCMTADEMKNIDTSLYPKIFPIWCTTDSCLYMMYKQDDGTAKLESLADMQWTDNPAILYPTIKANGNLTWELKYLSANEEIPEVNVVGKSAYEIWKDLGNEGTEADFIASLKGEAGADGTNGVDGADGQDGQTPVIEIGVNGNWYVNNVDTGASAKGEKGDDGKSSYDLWKEQEGNVDKTVEDFFAAMKGDPGADGQDGTNGLSPTIGENGNWFIGEEDTGVAAAGTNGTDGTNGTNGQDGTNGADGKSAYEIWKDLGNEGTEADFIASLKGEAGADGADGQDGTNGLSPTIGENGNWFIGEEDTGVAAAGTNGTDGTNGTNGQDGTNGADGKSAYDLWKEQEGNADKTVEDFFAAMKGDKGDPGDVSSALEISAIAPAYNSTTSYNDGDFVSYNGKLYNAVEVTTGDFNEEAWLEVTVLDMIRAIAAEGVTP